MRRMRAPEDGFNLRSRTARPDALPTTMTAPPVTANSSRPGYGGITNAAMRVRRSDGVKNLAAVDERVFRLQ